MTPSAGPVTIAADAVLAVSGAAVFDESRARLRISGSVSSVPAGFTFSTAVFSPNDNTGGYSYITASVERTLVPLATTFVLFDPASNADSLVVDTSAVRSAPFSFDFVVDVPSALEAQILRSFDVSLCSDTLCTVMEMQSNVFTPTAGPVILPGDAVLSSDIAGVYDATRNRLRIQGRILTASVDPFDSLEFLRNGATFDLSMAAPLGGSLSSLTFSSNSITAVVGDQSPEYQFQILLQLARAAPEVVGLVDLTVRQSSPAASESETNSFSIVEGPVIVPGDPMLLTNITAVYDPSRGRMSLSGDVSQTSLLNFETLRFDWKSVSVSFASANFVEPSPTLSSLSAVTSFDVEYPTQSAPFTFSMILTDLALMNSDFLNPVDVTVCDGCALGAVQGGSSETQMNAFTPTSGTVLLAGENLLSTSISVTHP